MRRRLLVALGIALTMVVAIGAVWWLAPGGRHGPFWDKYQRVQPGMTEEEVEAILGPPMYEDFPGGSLGPHDCAWDEGQQKICVSFETMGDPTSRVVQRRFLPETVWERLRRNGTDLGR